MSVLPDTIAVTPRGMRVYGFWCGFLGAFLAVFVVGIAGANTTLSRNAPCAAPGSANRALMEARQ